MKACTKTSDTVCSEADPDVADMMDMMMGDDHTTVNDHHARGTPPSLDHHKHTESDPTDVRTEEVALEEEEGSGEVVPLVSGVDVSLGASGGTRGSSPAPETAKEPPPPPPTEDVHSHSDNTTDSEDTAGHDAGSDPTEDDTKNDDDDDGVVAVGEAQVGEEATMAVPTTPLPTPEEDSAADNLVVVHSADEKGEDKAKEVLSAQEGEVSGEELTQTSPHLQLTALTALPLDLGEHVHTTLPTQQSTPVDADDDVHVLSIGAAVDVDDDDDDKADDMEDADLAESSVKANNTEALEGVKEEEEEEEETEVAVSSSILESAPQSDPAATNTTQEGDPPTHDDDDDDDNEADESAGAVAVPEPDDGGPTATVGLEPDVLESTASPVAVDEVDEVEEDTVNLTLDGDGEDADVVILGGDNSTRDVDIQTPPTISHVPVNDTDDDDDDDDDDDSAAVVLLPGNVDNGEPEEEDEEEDVEKLLTASMREEAKNDTDADEDDGDDGDELEPTTSPPSEDDVVLPVILHISDDDEDKDDDTSKTTTLPAQPQPTTPVPTTTDDDHDDHHDEDEDIEEEAHHEDVALDPTTTTARIPSLEEVEGEEADLGSGDVTGIVLVGGEKGAEPERNVTEDTGVENVQVDIVEPASTTQRVSADTAEPVKQNTTEGTDEEDRESMLISHVDQGGAEPEQNVTEEAESVDRETVLIGLGELEGEESEQNVTKEAGPEHEINVEIGLGEDEGEEPKASVTEGTKPGKEEDEASVEATTEGMEEKQEEPADMEVVEDTTPDHEGGIVLQPVTTRKPPGRPGGESLSWSGGGNLVCCLSFCFWFCF